MTYRYNRHKNAADLKTVSELIETRRLCIHMIREWTRLMSVPEATAADRAICRAEREWWIDLWRTCTHYLPS